MSDAKFQGGAPEWLIPKAVVPLTGDEAFAGGHLTVADFWRWGYSDLRTNVIRGVLAEFLVAKAVEDPSPLREAWDNWDVTTKGGIKVEVKSSAYLQSWNQRKLSSIVFGGLTGRAWSSETNELAAERTLRAEVYVFAVHSCREPEDYDPLRLTDWSFKVMSVRDLAASGAGRSVTLAFLERHSPATYSYAELRDAVEAAGPA
ncbi:MAG: hypothetical protein ACYDHT_02365 [Solirubrobacteraceae bacterium]